MLGPFDPAALRAYRDRDWKRVRESADLSAIEPMIEAIAEGMGEEDIRRALDEVKSRVGR